MDNEVAHAQLKGEVELVKKDITVLTNLCEKMDKVIERLELNHEKAINQIYTDMDKKQTTMTEATERRQYNNQEEMKSMKAQIERVNNDLILGQEKLKIELNHKIETTETKIINLLTELKSHFYVHVTDEENTLRKILQYKWALVGAFVVLAIFSKIDPSTIIKLVALTH